MTAESKKEHFLRLLEPVHDRLENFALAMTRDSEEARDLAAETILRAYESFERIRDLSTFAGYLLTIASHLHRRRCRRQRIFGAYNHEYAEQIPAPGPRPDLSADVRLLYRMLAELPAKQREAVVLFELIGFSLEEVRQVQGGSLSGVKSRLARGRKRLAELMEAVPGSSSIAVGRNSDAIAAEEKHPDNLTLLRSLEL